MTFVNPIKELLINKGKGKDKVHPRTGHEAPEGEKRFSSTLSLTSALDGVGGQRHFSGSLSPGKGSLLQYARRIPRAGLDGYGKSRSHWDSISGPPSS